MNLYELTAERKALQHKLESMELDAETIADTLEGNSTELEAKIADYGFVIRNLEAFADAMKAEEVRMADRRKAQEKRVAAIKAWLLQNMQACGISKIECPAFTISVKTNPPKVVVTDEKAIPMNFFHVPEPLPPQLDKKALAFVLKDNVNIPGAHLEQSQRIEIK